jgi:hypothetical protein
MRSNLAIQQRLALVAAVRRLTPEQRLDAFLAHSRLMAELYRSGRSLRRQPARR